MDLGNPFEQSPMPRVVSVEECDNGWVVTLQDIYEEPPAPRPTTVMSGPSLDGQRAEVVFSDLSGSSRPRPRIRRYVCKSITEVNDRITDFYADTNSNDQRR